LTEVFDDIADEFESAEPGSPTVKFSFAGSSDLVSQISEGAPADVIATADEETMDTLAGDDLLADQPSMLASNTLTLAVAEGSPASISTARHVACPALLARAPQVPCGAATDRRAGLNDGDLDPVSEENSVTDVLGKVSAGQADAGIVYVTDIARAS